MKRNTNPVKLVSIETVDKASTMLRAYEGRTKVEEAKMNTNETPIHFIKETIQNFRTVDRRPRSNKPPRT